MSTARWADAISRRISDEWSGTREDKLLLKDVLYKALKGRDDLVRRLIGTGIIEDDYFATFALSRRR